jgi:cytochrome c oxidase subunit 2
VFDPVSQQGKDISWLFILVLLIGAVVFLLVLGLVIYSIIRFRQRPGQEGVEPRQVSGNTRLEIAWTAAPAALLLILFVPTVMVMNSTSPTKPPDAQPDIEIIGHQWWWEYRYPKANVVTANELHIPVGKQILAKLQSKDVQHDFWVPQLGRKMDMYPDKVNYLYFQSDKPGLFLGNCAEYCGAEHAFMLIRVYAQPQAEFDAWLQKQATAPTTGQIGTSTSYEFNGQFVGNPVDGARIFQSNTCVNCHAVNGTNAKAQVAPNLTYLGTRTTLGAGIIENNPATLARWITNAQGIKPGILMPAYQFSKQDLSNLVAYLEAQK